MLLYRVTFSSSNGSHVCDVEAEDSDQAFRFAYAKLQNRDRYTDAAVEEITKGPKPIGIKFESYDHYAKKSYTDYNDSAQKTPAVRKNVRGMNAPITNNATIIPTGFSSGIVGFSWPDVLQNAVIRCIALLFQEKHFR